ncbi:MAG: lactate utilization protein C [Burkholderiales bacterium]|nr:lactate utilization protein C [Burkholderiales bacterium]
MSSARDRILASVRAALGRSGAPPQAQQGALAAYIAAHSSGPCPGADWDLLARFQSRALLLSSTLDDAETMAGVPAAVARYLAAQGLLPQAVVSPELARLDWQGAGIHAEARRAQAHDLVGITGSYCAIAETGTLVMVSGASAPPSNSLLPETHIAIVHAARIVRCMEDAFALLRAEQPRWPRSVNFVSGPSRTADIEQTIVLGAHGPYRVHVIVARAGSLAAEADSSQCHARARQRS